MKQKGRLQCQSFLTRLWFDSAYGEDLDLFMEDWLREDTAGCGYRWLEDGVAVYLPPCR